VNSPGPAARPHAGRSQPGFYPHDTWPPRRPPGRARGRTHPAKGRTPLTRLLNRRRAADCGAVLTLEYLTLGSVVAMGSAAGLASMKDAMVDECKEFGHAVREVNQNYRAPLAEQRPTRVTPDMGYGSMPQTYATP
jgi:hypothetical protein